eukprot:COSAG01_NODE_40326_length_465_cov_0.811475_1_plen_107_part_10
MQQAAGGATSSQAAARSAAASRRRDVRPSSSSQQADRPAVLLLQKAFFICNRVPALAPCWLAWHRVCLTAAQKANKCGGGWCLVSGPVHSTRTQLVGLTQRSSCSGR